jgi:shikimate kinase
MKIFLLGFMGAGKTYWGKNLSRALSLPYADLDEILVKQEGMSISKIFELRGEPHFRKLEKDALHSVAAMETFVVSCGGGTPCFFDNMDFMNGCGLTVWLDPSIERIAERLERKKRLRPLLADLSAAELRTYILDKMAERRPFYLKATHRVDPDGISLESFLQLLSHA